MSKRSNANTNLLLQRYIHRINADRAIKLLLITVSRVQIVRVRIRVRIGKYDSLLELERYFQVEIRATQMSLATITTTISSSSIRITIVRRINIIDEFVVERLTELLLTAGAVHRDGYLDLDEVTTRVPHVRHTYLTTCGVRVDDRVVINDVQVQAEERMIERGLARIL